MKVNPKSCSKPHYIFASCKPWHRDSFDCLQNANTGNWHYVSTSSELEAAIIEAKPRYIFFLHWNWIVPDAIWKAHECVCFHMTDVPYGRGGSPLQNLILAGHTETKLTALRMVKEMDAGPVYSKMPLSLEGNADEIYIRAGKLSAKIIQWMIEKNPEPTPQDGEVVIFKRRKPEQSNLPTDGNLRKAYDFIRMLDAEGYPKAFVEHGSYRIHFRNASLEIDRIIAYVEIKLNNQT